MLRYGDKGEKVRAVQTALKHLSAHMEKPSLDPGPVDGHLGPKTRQALNLWFAAAGIAHRPNEWDTERLHIAADSAGGVVHVPTMAAWFDRSGILSPGRCIELSRGVMDEVCLFLMGMKHKDYDTFKGATHLKNVTTLYKQEGIGVHWTMWSRPFTRAGKRNFRELVAAAADVGAGLDLDREWSSKGWKQADTDFLCDALRGFPGVVGVNDYASMQHETGKVIEALAANKVHVEARPQAYSVDHVTWKGHTLTQPDSVYWPGTTQRYAMSDKRWGRFANHPTVDLGIGLAIYKQVWSGRPMDARRSVMTQIQAAMEYKPNRLLFWDGERLQPGAAVRKVLLSLRG
jgi:hypothetical protein